MKRSSGRSFGSKTIFNVTPFLEAGTKWFDKLTILSKVEGPMGFPPWSRGPLLHRVSSVVFLKTAASSLLITGDHFAPATREVFLDVGYGD